MSEKEVLASANKYLAGEMKKRWPMLYKRRVNNCYVALLPNGYASHLQIICYASRRGQYVLRLTDVYDVAGECKVKSYYHYDRPTPGREAPIYSFGSFKSKSRITAPCEVTFTLEEIKEVVPWALDNYVAVKEWQKNMDNNIKNLEYYFGKPLGYIRSIKANQAL